MGTIDSGVKTPAGGDEEGWFDVEAYSSRSRWNGPDSNDSGVEGFKNKDDAIECAKGSAFDDSFEVVVVAYGQHGEFEPGEAVYSRRNRPQGEQCSESSVTAAEVALKAHTEHLGIDTREGGDSCAVWHLLVSLREFAAASGVDLDGELASVDLAIAGGEINQVAAQRALQSRKKQAS